MKVPRRKKGKEQGEDVSLTPEFIRNAAFRMLARRALTRRELSERLHKKSAAAELIVEVVDYCFREGYINESGITQDHIRRGREDRLVGRVMLSYELKRRGVEEMMIESSLDSEYPFESEIESARAFVSKKLRSLGNEDVDKSYRKVGGSLSRRGFASDIVNLVMREVKQQLVDR